MKKVLLDTNVYEFILKYLKRKEVEQLTKIFIVYGHEVVRKELRAIGKEKRIPWGVTGRSLRVALLTLYDFMTEKHQYRLTRDAVVLAEKYYVAYRSFGGSKDQHELLNDLMIVACASLKGLDVVVSEDKKTMLAHEEQKAYELANSLENLRTPDFIGFEELQRKLGGVKLD